MEKISNQYLAGFIDGEGYLGIYKIRRGNKKDWSVKNDCFFRAIIEVGNTNREVIDLFKGRFGGYIKTVKEGPNRGKELYVWRYDNNRVAGVIDEVYPFLIVKKRHADVLRKFFQTFNNKENVWEKREKLWQEISKLNIKRRRDNTEPSPKGKV